MGGLLTTPRVSPNAPYGVMATRPLHVLVFLIPLMMLYELGSLAYLSVQARGADTIGARGILGSFFESFGVASLHLPPLALSVVLIVWHMLLRDPWRVRPKVVGVMAIEAALWAVPLLVLGLVFNRGAAAAVPGGDAALRAFSWQARLTISLGAGLYEELLFRLILISAVHFVLVDLFRLKDGVGFALAAIVSALAFAFYHDLSLPGGGVSVRKLLFFAAAGLYFAVVFIMRGFGIAVAAHAYYDVVALLVFEQARHAA